ncbi:hypothetical protein PoB_005311600, partial [Plakobranchus ocellatus]
MLTAYLSNQSATEFWVGLSEKKNVSRISGYFRWDAGQPKQPTTAVANRCVYIATNSYWRLTWCHEFKDYVCQTSNLGFSTKVAPITASPKISIQKASKRPNVLKFWEKVQVSCSAFHADGASLYFTFTAPGVMETKRPGDKNVSLLRHNTLAYDNSSGFCWLRSSAVWEVSAGEKHQGGHFSCCRQHPPGCARSATKFVDFNQQLGALNKRWTSEIEFISTVEWEGAEFFCLTDLTKRKTALSKAIDLAPRLQLIPARVFKGQNATLKCAFHNIVGKDLLWLIDTKEEILLRIDENGSLYRNLYDKGRFRWKLRAAGSLLFPRSTAISAGNISIRVLHQA